MLPFTFRYHPNMVTVESYMCMANNFRDAKKGQYFAQNVTFEGLTSDSVVMFGFGLNEGVSNAPRLNMTTLQRVQQGFGHFADQVRKLPPAQRPHLLWMNLPATGSRKPPEFLSTQGKNSILDFNAGTPPPPFFCTTRFLWRIEQVSKRPL